jgi:hypothetical protein
MDPTIAAAWITGGVGGLGIAGTVATAIVGSRSTRKATETTVAAGAATTAATLAAAREDRLWERRAAAYEEFLTGLLIRQAKRRYGLREDALDVDQLETIHDDSDPLGPPEAQGRLTAYASDAVLEAFRFAGQAHIQVVVQTNGMVDGFKETIAARRAVDLPAKAAEAADEALIKLIRNELRRKPEAAVVPATALAKRRRFWHRR